jgi:hypothetical protein
MMDSVMTGTVTMGEIVVGILAVVAVLGVWKISSSLNAFTSIDLNGGDLGNVFEGCMSNGDDSNGSRDYIMSDPEGVFGEGKLVYQEFPVNKRLH